MLNPLFSLKHIREILPVFYPDVNEASSSLSGMKLFFMGALQMCGEIALRAKDGPAVVNIMQWFGRAALELIGRGGLGHSFGPLNDEASTEYSAAIKEIT